MEIEHSWNIKKMLNCCSTDGLTFNAINVILSLVIKINGFIVSVSKVFLYESLQQ